MSIGSQQESIAIRAVNTFYISAMILDIASAMLSFLTSRWLQRLSDDEKELLEFEFSRQAHESGKARLDVVAQKPPFPDEEKGEDWNQIPFLHKIVYRWFSLSLFIPMPLLVLGVACMICGIYTYTWTQQPIVVATIVTFAGVAVLPFVVGIFLIGRGKERRKVIICRLSLMQGDW
jgi:hypothetical protein